MRFACVLLIAGLSLACSRVHQSAPGQLSRSEAEKPAQEDAQHTHASSPDPAAMATSTPSNASPHSSDDEHEASPAGVLSAPFGPAHAIAHPGCRQATQGRVSDADTRTSFAEARDILALVNRSPQGQLAPGDAPTDLVDLFSGRGATANECETRLCLRSEAAGAIGKLLDEMKRRGFAGKVQSAFRSYASQCTTFAKWAEKGGFCAASEQSALPGHSQHQLGTTVDLFTEAWAQDPRGVFRDGFGCTPAGIFLQEHATRFGFVVSYPLHPDDRHPDKPCTSRWDIPVSFNPKTGYRFEHWHLRYLGEDNAKRYAQAAAESGIGTPNELTLEQWLRRERGISSGTSSIGDTELPVCDGCNCGACSTFSALGSHVCDRETSVGAARATGALHLDARGLPVLASEWPRITLVRATRAREKDAVLIEVTLDVPPGLATQPPVVDADLGVGYLEADAAFDHFTPYRNRGLRPRSFPPLAGAWVIGVEPASSTPAHRYVYRAAISSPALARIYNRTNALLPAQPGAMTLRIPLPASSNDYRIALLEGGTPRGTPMSVSVPAKKNQASTKDEKVPASARTPER